MVVTDLRLHDCARDVRWQVALLKNEIYGSRSSRIVSWRVAWGPGHEFKTTNDPAFLYMYSLHVQ